ncbi:MAG: TolC family protein [Isosphaeraceae bacterium]|nr:TolC family protein [Isosphaeraceae bacterium]
MNGFVTRWASLAVLLGIGQAAIAQEPTDGVRPPDSPRLQLPFATMPDRLPGPPRAMGVLPIGEGLPPTTLPGRDPNAPPRAMGESPDLPPVFQQPVGPQQTRISPFLPNPSTVRNLGSFSLPSPSFILPWSLPLTPDPSRAEQVAPITPATVDREGPPLFLEEVLSSAERGYPPYLAMLQERGVAGGEVLSAMGSFDLNFNSDSRNYPLGYYNRSIQDVFLEQPLMNAGGKVFAGYRIAQGRWPNYYNYLNTRSGGAFVAGLELPILKNREIDAKRAKLMQLEIERRKVEPTISKSRIELFKSAAKAYWDWVAAGRNAEIAKELVRVAEERGAGLDQQVRAGLVRPIDMVDFRKILIVRQQQEVAARRRFEAAAIDLSLYLRDSYCLPTMPEPRSLPPEFPDEPPPDAARFEQDLEVALRLRPEILSVRYQIQKAQIDKAFAVNQMLPSLNLYVFTEQNVGNRALDLGKDFRPFVMESSLLFDVPIQRRFARGRIISSEAVLRQLSAQAQFAGEKVRADLLDSLSAVRAAYEVLQQARDGLNVSRKLADAERILLSEGGSNVLLLNLREQALSDSQIYVYDAEAKYRSTLAEYRGALGVDALPPERSRPPAPR